MSRHDMPDIAVTRRHDSQIRGVSHETFIAWGAIVAKSNLGSGGRHRAPADQTCRLWRIIEGVQVQMSDRCSWFARGSCGASIDGYCVGGTADGRCQG